MLIQTQTGFGEVIALFPVPETVPPSPLTADEFAVRLKDRVQDMTRIEDVSSDKIERRGKTHDRVTVTLEYISSNGTFDSKLFHEAVGLVAMEHLLPIGPNETMDYNEQEAIRVAQQTS